MFDIAERSTAWNYTFVDALRNPAAVDWQAFLSVYGGACDEPTCSVATEIIRSFADGMMPSKNGDIDNDGGGKEPRLGQIHLPGPSVNQCTTRRCHRPIKVILLTRSPSAWWTSMQSTVFRHGRPSDVSVIGRFKQFLILAKPGGGQAWSFLEVLKHTRMERYHEGYMDEHARIVQSAVEDANERLSKEGIMIPLLEYQVKDGWEPLCNFLDMPVPDIAFPRVNDTASFQRRFRKSMAIGAGWWLLWISVAAVGSAGVVGLLRSLK